MTTLKSQPTAKPTRKLKYTGIASVITVAVVAVADYYLPGLGSAIEPAVAAALVSLISWTVGYMTRERA